jgi:hypothetical protein
MTDAFNCSKYEGHSLNSANYTESPYILRVLPEPSPSRPCTPLLQITSVHQSLRIARSLDVFICLLKYI